MESQNQWLQEAASGAAKDENLTEKVHEMVLPSVRSIAEKLNPGTSHPTQILLGKDNTAISGCNFNITNIYGGDNDALQKSFVAEAGAPCPLPSSSVHKPEEPQPAKTSKSPLPKWTKPKQEMLLRVVPLATEMEGNCDDDLILVVWICWDDDKTFQKIVTSEHDSGNVTLDSYDTIILRKPVGESLIANTITIRVSTNRYYSWGPRRNTKRIQCSQVWNAQRAKCSFRIRKNPDYPDSQLMYITLLIQQNDDPTDTEFILRKRISDIRMPKKQKRQLLQLLDTKISVPSTTHSFSVRDDSDNRRGFHGNVTEKSSFTCWAIPYVDKMFSHDDDVIVTLWLCWFDEGGKLLEALKGEQKLYSRLVLDTENSFFMANAEEYIKTEMTHSGNLYQKSIAAQRIVQGMRAKFQFISKRMENSDENADRMAHQRLPDNSRQKPGAKKLLPEGTAEKLDVEIITRQGDQEPIEFRKVAEISRFLCGKMKEAHKRQMPLVRAPCKNRVLNNSANPTSRDSRKLDCYSFVIPPGSLKYGGKGRPGGWLLQSSGGRLANWPAGRWVAAGSQADQLTPFGQNQRNIQEPCFKTTGAHISHLYYQQIPGNEDKQSSIYIQDRQQHVLRLYNFASQDNDCDSALTMHVVLGALTSPSGHNQLLTQDEVHKWAAIDSYDTFLLTSQVGGCYDPLVRVTFEPHRTSHWLPESDKMVIDTQDLLKEGVVKCSCRFTAATNSQNDFLYVTVRISQTVGKSKEEVRFVVKKKMENIYTLVKEARNSALDKIFMSPVQRPEDADDCVMLDEYQTCLAVSYVDLMQNITDDIVLTVWICSIQQSKTDFSILCKDQKKFMKIQLDTENSFVFTNMISPVNAEVKLYGLWRVEDPVKTVDPRRIRDGGRAKFQFMCKRRHTNKSSNKFDVEITINQNNQNEVQFMTRKKVEFFLQDELPLNSQDTETEIT